MKLGDVLSGVSLLHFEGSREEDIQGLTYDSRKIQPGFLFAAMKGEKTDGNDYIQQAVASGAAAVLSHQSKPESFSKAWIQVTDAREALGLCSANFYRHPSSECKIIGITGTKGKTTITYLLEAILNKAGSSPGVFGTISYRGPEMEIEAKRTTPESSDLQQMLRQMVSKGVTHCLMEVSSHSLDLKRVSGIDFDLAVFTNLSGEHMDYHVSMENYYQAKKKLFLPGRKKKMAVVNADDKWGQKLRSELTIDSVTFGLESPASVFAKKYSLSEKGIDLIIDFQGRSFALLSPLLGKPNVYNILAAVACALSLDIPLPAITEGIRSLPGVPGRFEKVPNALGLQIFVDYAHTDDALKNLLETARELALKKTIIVFGAGGDRDRTKRPRMGAVAGALADVTIVTSDNPRSEDPLAIIAEIEQGLKEKGTGKYVIQPDRRKAIEQALSIAEKGDTILVAGKGHEDYQILGDRTISFSDRDVILELIGEKEAGL
jgi:UDP-N-acetylmuramoyl-L-alanyl-D-glutamate--2,6-diaminopimelate ligase